MSEIEPEIIERIDDGDGNAIEVEPETIVARPMKARRLKRNDLILVVGRHAPASIEWLKVTSAEHDYDGDGSSQIETEEGKTLYFYARDKLIVGRRRY